MRDTLVDMRNVRFMLYEVLGIERFFARERYAAHDRESMDMVLDTAYELAREVLWPSYQEIDQIGVQFDGQRVTVPEAVHTIWKRCKEDGWFAPSVDYEKGGQQIPLTVYGTTMFLFNAANTSAYMYVGAAYGTAYLIDEFATPEQRKTYCTKLWAGEWGGTMCLSEPDVGSSLGDLTTRAVKAPGGDHYLISGTKRWISSGDHDLAENIVHPVLARIEGAPAGSKGITLFLVPKYRPNADGSAGAFNDVKTVGIEHKLGLRAQATATLNFGENGDCHGWLLGEENQGLKHMLHLVNSARIHTGLQAVSLASTAYHVALGYAHERLQGRDWSNPNPASPPVPIIRHADVRLMLLWQRAYVEGLYGLLAYCAALGDERLTVASPEEAEAYEDLLGVLTPVCKSYGSDMAFESIRLAIQCLGGAGFTEDFPLAQLLRDSRVFSIYEGTNSINAMDLLGRRVVKKNGEAFQALMLRIAETLAEARSAEGLSDLADTLGGVLEKTIALTQHLAGIGLGGDITLYLCNATLYQRAFSEMVVAWQWLLQAITAQRALAKGGGDEAYYRGKVATARFYIENTLPHTLVSIDTIQRDERNHLDFKEEWFGCPDPAGKA